MLKFYRQQSNLWIISRQRFTKGRLNFLVNMQCCWEIFFQLIPVERSKSFISNNEASLAFNLQSSGLTLVTLRRLKLCLSTVCKVLKLGLRTNLAHKTKHQSRSYVVFSLTDTFELNSASKQAKHWKKIWACTQQKFIISTRVFFLTLNVEIPAASGDL